MRAPGVKEVVSTVSLLTRAVISLENCRPQVREGQAEEKKEEKESQTGEKGGERTGD